MPEELKPVLARQMEIYAGFLEQTDHEVGRVIDAIADLGVLENTLVFIIGDNGASAEGTPNGCFNEMCMLNGMAAIETPEFLLEIDDFGTPTPITTRGGLGARTAPPTNGPNRSPTHWGGTRNGRSCTGPRAWPKRAPRAVSSITSSTLHRRSWRRRGFRHPCTSAEFSRLP